MQKILRRAATAQRVVERKAKKGDIQTRNQEKRKDKSHYQQVRGQIYDELEKGKQIVRDNWKLGPLARRTDTDDFLGIHGTLHEARFGEQGPEPNPRTIKARANWAGGISNIVENDRVVILAGPDKGRIGKIIDVNDKRATVTVEGLNKSNIRSPPYMTGPEDPKTYTLEIPVPISEVRLVHPIQDPATGVTKDVIINQLVSRNQVHDRQTSKTRWDRIVPGLNIAIPWPAKPPKEEKDHPVDTLRITVDQRTFIPTLLRPPMPETVIDELRNKYSRFRTRHEPEFIAKLEAAEQAEKNRANLMDSIRTPIQEFNRAERANKKKKGKPRLTIEMLEEIGKVIAKNRERTANAIAADPDASATTPYISDAVAAVPAVEIAETSVTPEVKKDAPPPPAASS